MLKKTLGIGLLIVVLASLSLPFPPANAVTLVSIDPQITTVWGADETFTVSIMVSDVFGLYGWELQLFYDPSILTCLNASEGSFLRNAGETYLDVSINNTHGIIRAFNTLKGQIPGIDGSGILLTVTFSTEALGISFLDIADVTLVDPPDPSSNIIPCTEVDAIVQVLRQTRDVSITNVQVSSNRLVSGQILDIQVTAANPGKKTETFYVNVYSNETAIGQHAVVGLLPLSTSVFNVSWDTGVISPNATCLIKAEASQVPDEEVTDNNIFVYGTVSIISGTHNVALTSVSCSSSTVYQGDAVYVQVIAANKGDYTESFNVTAYYDTTAIGVQRMINLTYGKSALLFIPWDTESVPPNRTYVIRAVADPVTGETNLADNTLADGNVTVNAAGALSIQIMQVIPISQLGNPVTSFAIGTTATFSVTMNCTLIGTKTILLTINILDVRGSTIGVVSFQGPIASGVTTFMLGLPIPTNAALGNAVVYATALSDWPHVGGVTVYSEKTAAFGIRGS